MLGRDWAGRRDIVIERGVTLRSSFRFAVIAAALVGSGYGAAAQYYPAAYWYALLKIPPAKDFGGSTEIPKNITQDNWLRQMNNVDCVGCHQLGQLSTRTIPPSLGQFASGTEAWIRRVASGQTGESMTNRLAGQFGGVPYKYFGDWTD